MEKNSRYSTDNSYRQSHASIDGSWYHESFDKHNHIKLMWDIEKYILAIILDGYKKDPSHMDFACGSGRIISYLKEKTKNPIGVDVSASMLKAAIDKNPELTFMQVDITQEEIFKGKKFDLITAFRFFPNAEPKLRKDALKEIFKLLKDDGILIFNNHRNSNLWRSLKGFLNSKTFTLDNNTIENLLNEMGFHVIRRFNVLVLPVQLLLSPDKKVWFPLYKILLRIEKALVKQRAFLLFASNIIYVCKKSN